MKINIPNSTYQIRWVLALCTVAALSACGTPPTINTTAFAAPKRVIIQDIPDLKFVADIGVIVPTAPTFPGFHFSSSGDHYFVETDPNAVPADVQRLSDPLYGSVTKNDAIYSMAYASANRTQAKAQGFDAQVHLRQPQLNLRTEFLGALRKSLEAQGIAVSFSPDGRTVMPRVRWRAADAQGNVYPLSALASTPAVDADLLVQVSPIAFYNAPGPLNAYRRNVSVAVVLFDGHTRQFIGRQTLGFSSFDTRYTYMKYDTLFAQADEAAPGLRDALLSLIPQITDLINAKPHKQ